MARDFNGSSDKTGHGLAAEQNNLTTWSFGGWFYLDSNAQYKRIVQKGSAWPNADWDLEFDDGWGMVFTNIHWSTNSGAWSIPKPATGAWTHILVTYDMGSTANDPAIYVNGASQTVTERGTPSGTAPANSQSTLYLGSDSGNGQYYDGRMAEFAMWNRVLTAAEADIIGAKKYSPLFVSNGLVMYVPLIGRTSPELELINGANGTLTGTSVIEHPSIIYPYGDPIGIKLPNLKETKKYVR